MCAHTRQLWVAAIRSGVAGLDARHVRVRAGEGACVGHVVGGRVGVVVRGVAAVESVIFMRRGGAGRRARGVHETRRLDNNRGVDLLIVTAITTATYKCEGI